MAAIVINVLLPAQVFAAQLADRSLTLGTSAGNVSTTWTFEFEPSDTTALNGITFQVCEDPSGTCNIPNGWTNSGATLDSLTYDSSGQAGWAMDPAPGYLRIKNNSSAAPAVGPIVATFSAVTNPDTTNETFYVRIITYTDDDFAGAHDDGVVAASTSEQITLSGSMNESLTFCVGLTMTGENCGTVSGNSIDLGTFSASATSYDTSVMAASTNSAAGYSITVNGSTLTCSGCAGTPTIAAVAAPQTQAAIGTAQFGLNLKDNGPATPPDVDVGAEVTGAGSGAATSDYGLANRYSFGSGEAVASAPSVTAANKFTVSYIVNVPGDQPAGLYTAVMTYICTSQF